jgi:hypothetical protein
LLIRRDDLTFDYEAGSGWTSDELQGDRKMKKLMFSGIALAGLLSIGVGHAQTVGQDMKDAGHDTAHASKTVAHKTVRGTKVATRDTVHGTKTATRDTVHGTKVVGHKTERVTKKGYHKTATGTKKVVHKIDGKPATE